MAEDLSDLTDAFDEWARQVYELKGKGANINRDVYFHNADRMANALMKGFDAAGTKVGVPAVLKAHLQNNIYAFSAAKTAAEHRLMADALTDSKGKPRTFNMFREQVEKINPLFNERYLKVEYDNALAQGRAVAEWERFKTEADQYPYLIYKTMEDDRVRLSHQALEGVKLPVGHRFWNTYRPPNGWGCRCYLLQSDTPRGLTPDNAAYASGTKSNTSPMFKNNPGESSVVYKDNLPYFKKLSGSVTDLDALKNYGMKNFRQVMKDAEDNGFTLPDKMNEEQFEAWWESKAGNGLNFTLKDVKGNDILLNADPRGHRPSFTKEHLFRKKHYDYAHLIEETLKNPSEAWSFIDAGIRQKPLLQSYLRYYRGDAEHRIFVVIVREDKEALRVVTSYFIDRNDEKLFNNLRKGALLHAKKRF